MMPAMVMGIWRRKWMRACLQYVFPREGEGGDCLMHVGVA
jgi:hypothetical protein